MRALLRRSPHALAWSREQAEDLGGPVAGAAEPVRLGGVELHDFSDLDHSIVVTNDQAHPAAEHVDPLVAFMDPGIRDGL